MTSTTFLLLLDGPDDAFGLQADRPETPVTPQGTEVSEEQQRTQKIKEAIQHSHESPVMKAKMAISRVQPKPFAELDEDSSLDDVALQKITQLVNMDDDSDSDLSELNKLFPNAVRTIKLSKGDQDNIDRMLRLERSKNATVKEKVRKRRQISEEPISLASEASSDVALTKRAKRKFAKYGLAQTESEREESTDDENGDADYAQENDRDEINDLVDSDDIGSSSLSSSQHEPLSQSSDNKCVTI
ncbi:hypothetical protein KL941_000887 [Ogataea angusta]|nr:hypothetical protein KL941_000887 [Ogataea angusta]